MGNHSNLIFFLVAVLSVGTLACSSGTEPAPTVPPPIPTSGITPTAEIPPTATPVATSAKPTKTPTLTPTLPRPSATTQPTPTQIPSTPIPTNTPTASPTPEPTPTQIPSAHTSTPTTSPTPEPTPTPSPTAKPTATPTAEAKTLSGLTESQLIKGRDHALALINEVRNAEGLQPVTLDDNSAAQSHAEDMRANCFLSHYGSDGSKPYMRYTAAGGQQSTTSVINGIGYCPEDAHRYRRNTINTKIDQSMDSLLGNDGTSRIILDSLHRKVNIGVSFEHPNLWFVLMFVGDYVSYSHLPSLNDGILRFAGKATNGITVSHDTLDVVIRYDAPPSALTRGQIHNVGCFEAGMPVAAINPPGRYDTFRASDRDCQDPQAVAPDAPPAQSYDDKRPRIQPDTEWKEVALVDAKEWLLQDTSFSISADFTEIIHEHGTGVYTINIWGELSGEDTKISEYSIFVDSLPPPPTPTPTPELTPTPEPTPATPHLRHIDYKAFMLQLINEERTRAGLGTVTLGENDAAQSHAESSLENCISSHWGIDGLKPYMRYSIAGGYQSNGENVAGSDYCITPSDGYRALSSIEEEIAEAIEGWMDSSGHRRNLLNPLHKMVNIGIAWDEYNFIAIQQFEGDYVLFSALPAIQNGILSFFGSPKNGANLGGERDLGVQIYYDPLTHPLTRGQIARTYGYDRGLIIAALRPPPEPGRRYTSEKFTTEYRRAERPDPYAVPADAPPAQSREDARRLWQAAYDASQEKVDRVVESTWVTATDWSVTNDSFAVSADISSLLAQHGDGVYTILIWGEINGERTPISEYSIFIPPYSPAP